MGWGNDTKAFLVLNGKSLCVGKHTENPPKSQLICDQHCEKMDPDFSIVFPIVLGNYSTYRKKVIKILMFTYDNFKKFK